MRVPTVRDWTAAVLIGVVCVVPAACAGAEASTGTALPTFVPTTAPAAPTAAGPPGCAKLLDVADIAPRFGLAADAVNVRTTVGLPSPSVGRTERIDCTYTPTTGGTALLTLRSATYTDADAARKQWRLNADLETGKRTETQVGTAPAVLVERPGETLLTLVDGTGTITLILPARKLPSGDGGPEVVTDIAQRMLPDVAPPAPTPAPTTP